ncbi:hypothetical protein T484DRAFT_1888816, partial [Baffinella frigidus]
MRKARGDFSGTPEEMMVQFGERNCNWTVAPQPADRRGMLVKSRKFARVKSRKFARVLRELGSKLALVSPSLRAGELRQAVTLINDRLPPCLYFPLFSDRYSLFWLLSIRAEECKVFHTNKRAPFLCVAEINVVTLAGGKSPETTPGPEQHSRGLSDQEALEMLGEGSPRTRGGKAGDEGGEGEAGAGRARGPEAAHDQEGSGGGEARS